MASSSGCPFTRTIVERQAFAGGRRVQPSREAKEKVKSYCSCLAKVSAKQKKGCLPLSPKTKATKGCYNPYAICGRIYPKGQGRVYCTEHYDYEEMPEEEVRGVAALHGKTVKQLVKYSQLKKEEKAKKLKKPKKVNVGHRKTKSGRGYN